MLSEIEMTAFVGKHAVDEMRAVPAAPSDTLRLPGEELSPQGDSFFYVAMRISEPETRACRRDGIR